MVKVVVWIYSSGKLAKPGDEFVGPFYFVKNGEKNTIYALGHKLEQSQNDFMLQYASLHPPKPFPIFSSISLLYPTLSILTSTNMSITSIFGYGLINLGYLLAAASVISGSFRALGLDYRIQVLCAAVIFFFVGLFLFNV
jgi:hypothetical protein